MVRLKKWSWIFVIVLIAGIIICVFPWRHKIDTVIQGAEYRIGDADYSEDITITVKGIYRQYLLKSNTFEGTFSVSKYNFTSDVLIAPTAFCDGYTNLTYSDITNGVPHISTLGILCCSSSFDKLLICVSEPVDADSKSWNGENGLFICAPAESRTQALEIAQTLSGKSEWLSHTNWK